MSHNPDASRTNPDITLNLHRNTHCVTMRLSIIPTPQPQYRQRFLCPLFIAIAHLWISTVRPHAKSTPIMQAIVARRVAMKFGSLLGLAATLAGL